MSITANRYAEVYFRKYDGTYSGRRYTYILPPGVAVEKGDFVKVPVGPEGEIKAVRVACVTDRAPGGYAGKMKSVTEKCSAEETAQLRQELKEAKRSRMNGRTGGAIRA